MIRQLPLAAILALSACANDYCYTHRDDVQDCLNRQRLDPRIECACEMPESGTRYEAPEGLPPAGPPGGEEPVGPERNHEEPPGRKGDGRNEDDYDRWKRNGWW